MKKVLILTVIAILALGVMALAEHATCNNNLYISGTVNVTVSQWTEGSFDANDITFCDYGNSGYKVLGDLHIYSNGKYKVFVNFSLATDSIFQTNYITGLKWALTGNPITASTPETLSAGATATREDNGNTITNVSALEGYGLQNTTNSGWFGPDETDGTDGNLEATFNIPQDLKDNSDLAAGKNYDFVVNIWVISHANDIGQNPDLSF
jgi:hypothetical protein